MSHQLYQCRVLLVQPRAYYGDEVQILCKVYSTQGQRHFPKEGIAYKRWVLSVSPLPVMCPIGTWKVHKVLLEEIMDEMIIHEIIRWIIYKVKKWKISHQKIPSTKTEDTSLLPKSPS
jgi:hypothetical protein